MKTPFMTSKIVLLILAVSAVLPYSAECAEIRIMCPGAYVDVLTELAPGLELTTELLPRLGIADQVRSRMKRIEKERVGMVVARGEAEIGFQQISELLPIEGIDYVGPLPPEVQRTTLFSIGVATGSKNSDAAQDVIKFLTSPAAAATTAKSGLEPVTRQ